MFNSIKSKLKTFSLFYQGQRMLKKEMLGATWVGVYRKGCINNLLRLLCCVTVAIIGKAVLKRMVGNIKLKKASLTASRNILMRKQFSTSSKRGRESQFNTISKRHSKNALKERKERVIMQMDRHNAFFPLSLSIH